MSDKPYVHRLSCCAMQNMGIKVVIGIRKNFGAGISQAVPMAADLETALSLSTRSRSIGDIKSSFATISAARMFAMIAAMS